MEFAHGTSLEGRLRVLALLSPWLWFQGSSTGNRGARLRLALEELGPVFVKFGQALSTRRDLLPPDIAEELVKLQDEVPPFDGATARGLIEASLGQPVDKTEWGMTPPTVNAYYDPTKNEIALPAGQLRKPFFDPDGDIGANMGGMGGGTIGHEVTHGFDDEGRQFDAQGNLKDWWTADDEKRFKQRAQKVVDQFNQFVIIDTFHVNGALSLGENLADFGGMVIAYDALEKALGDKQRALIDGFTPEQRFFISYAQSWRIDVRAETQRLRAATDPHSPPKWRVNGPLANMPSFAKAFGCKAGDAMVQADSLRAEVW